MAKLGIAPINSIAVTSCVISLAVGALTGAALDSRAPLVAGALVGAYLLFAIKVVRQWEKAALLRLGKYVGLRGPGLFLIVPVIETLSQFVDQRVRVASVSAESTLTRDTVPVNVDAIVFWLVWNAEKAILEVEDFFEAINMSAQTALRESIGRHELAQMITERETLGRELQRILDEKTNPWGITVQSVEVRESGFRKLSKMPCHVRHRPSANARRESFSVKPRLRSQIILCKPQPHTPKIQPPFTCAP